MSYVPNNGSSPFEILGLLVVEPSLCIIVELLHQLFVCIGLSSLASVFKNGSKHGLSFVIQSVFVTSLFLFSATIWSDDLSTVLTLILATILFLVGVTWTFRQTKLPFKWSTIWESKVCYKDGRLPHLEDFRGHLLHMTAICILAVDFDIFPVRYAKTDTYGWSVMDVGVGVFVGAHAVCSRQARGKSLESLNSSFVSSLPLVILGFARLIAVTVVNYHRVISEYGVHWNFFFTLAFTKVICALLNACTRIGSGALALMVLLLHQGLLSLCGMTDYINEEERDGLLDDNKEGICSLLGFVAIFFGSVKVGELLWRPRSKMKDYFHLIKILLLLWLSSWLAAHGLHLYVQPTSRRMANLPYCVWTISIMCLYIAIHLTFHVFLHIYDRVLSGTKDKPIIFTSNALWKSVNYNGLFYFLLANVLTGLVNLSMDTSEASPQLSLLILSSYLAILTAVSKCAWNYSIQLKFW